MSMERAVEDRIRRALLEAAPDRLPDRVLESTFARTRSMAQVSRGARGTPVGIPRAPLVAAAAVIAIAVLAVSLAIAPQLDRRVGSSPSPVVPDTFPVVAPPPPAGSPDVPASPSVVPAMPSVDPAPASSSPAGPGGWSELFTSERYGYSIRHPVGWTAAQGSGAIGFGSDTITAPSPSTVRLSIVRRPLPDGQAFGDYVEASLPHRTRPDGYCRWQGGGIIAIPGPWEHFDPIEIDGHGALVRSECSVVDAAIEVGGDVIFVVLRSQRRMPTGDRYTFDRFVETMTIEDAVPVP